MWTNNNNNNVQRQNINVDRISQQAMMDRQQMNMQSLNPVPLDNLMPLNTRMEKRGDMQQQNPHEHQQQNPHQHQQQNPHQQVLFHNQQQQQQPLVYQQQVRVQPRAPISIQQGAFMNTNVTNIIDPFDVLGVPRNITDERIVKEVYNKWVMRLHPDRGGDPAKFQEVTRAFNMVMEALQQTKSEDFNFLKQRAEHDLVNMQGVSGFNTGTKDGNANPSLAPLGNGLNFDKQTFNSVFNQNKMWTPADDGYGDQMVGKNVVTGGPMTMEQMMALRESDPSQTHIPDYHGTGLHGVSGQAYTQKFNSTFDENAMKAYEIMNQKRNIGQNAGTAMVKRVEPEAFEVFKSATSLCTALSVEKIDDFGTPFNSGGGSNAGGAYCDYMKAFSTDSLITPHVADAQGHGYKTVEQLEHERAQLSFTPSQDILHARTAQEAAMKEQDELRWRNFQRHQEKIQEHNLAIRNLLSDKSSVGKK